MVLSHAARLSLLYGMRQSRTLSIQMFLLLQQ